MPVQFFTNSSGGYGSAVPFQRVVEPQQLGMFLNLEQAELLRISRYNEAWRFYLGHQWMFKREDGEPLVTLNYLRKAIDKSVEFMVANGFSIQTPEVLEQTSKPFCDEVWDYNQRGAIEWEIATTGSVTGDVFVLITYEEPSAMQLRVNPFSQGRIRVNLLGSEQVFPTWDPVNTNVLMAVRIETIFYNDRGNKQLNTDDDAHGDAGGRQLMTKRFTQIITPDQVIEQFHGEMPVIKRNLLGEIPLVHMKNTAIPKEYYGLSDCQDLIDVQRELNEKCTDVSDTINYHAQPITIVQGAKAKSIEKGARQLWSGLPSDAKVYTLKLEGDLTAARSYIDFTKKAFHELSDVPEGALGAMQPISNTSGVALHLQYQPLVGKTKKKRAQYEPGFAAINYFILRIGVVQGLIDLPYDLCKACGGRIIEVFDENADGTPRMRKRWDPVAQTYVDEQVKKKRCYHVDPMSLEFMDPFQMRVKFWRQYGFGRELRDMPYGQVIREIQSQKPSFWDYSVYQEAALEAWREQNASKIQAAHDIANPQPPPPQTGLDGAPLPPPEPGPPALSPVLTPQVHAAPPQVKPPPGLNVHPFADGDLDLPEEPEEVTIERRWAHPETGAVVHVEQVVRLLVPTGCQKPAYLNPFLTKVTFNDVLPKDKALDAALYGQYKDMGIVDEEWIQDQIPEIAHDQVEIRKRMKFQRERDRRMEPAALIENGPNGQQATYQGELAPQIQNQNAVIGPGGNPVQPGQGE